MPQCWHAIHQHLLSSSSTLSFRRRFDVIRASNSPLVPFRDPEALLESLHRAGDPDTKNRVLTAFVETAQGNGPVADTALTTLLLALWPGMDAIRARLLRYFRHDPDTLGTEILSRITLGIRTLDRARVARIAATLLRNTERDLRRELMARAQDETVSVPDEFLEHLPAAADPVIDRLDLARALSTLGPQDRALVVAVAIGGWSQVEAAKALGLAPEAGRKRCQRAFARLRRFLDPEMSRTGAPDGFSPATATKRGKGQGHDGR